MLCFSERFVLGRIHPCILTIQEHEHIVEGWHENLHKKAYKIQAVCENTIPFSCCYTFRDSATVFSTSSFVSQTHPGMGLWAMGYNIFFFYFSGVLDAAKSSSLVYRYRIFWSLGNETNQKINRLSVAKFRETNK